MTGPQSKGEYRGCQVGQVLFHRISGPELLKKEEKADINDCHGCGIVDGIRVTQSGVSVIWTKDPPALQGLNPSGSETRLFSQSGNFKNEPQYGSCLRSTVLKPGFSAPDEYEAATLIQSHDKRHVLGLSRRLSNQIRKSRALVQSRKSIQELPDPCEPSTKSLQLHFTWRILVDHQCEDDMGPRLFGPSPQTALGGGPSNSIEADRSCGQTSKISVAYVLTVTYLLSPLSQSLGGALSHKNSMG
ncbi:hypothetical protein FPV67DRAFT_1450033 [Lyophyllum atratum]|nr:hypothetical protein FPV67DRAFT_1450033 [Lyophyllum atratum]